MENSLIKILLVDDEADALEFLSYTLKKENYQVFTAQNGLLAIEIAKKEKPDLIILDIMMPEMDGVEVCRELRAIPELQNVIIAFLTARSEDYSQLAAFDVGADDYIIKPIKPRIFLSRVKALIRRRNSEFQNQKKLTIKELTIDYEKYTVTKGNYKIDLRKKEFELLALLISKPGKVFTREEIMQTIWEQNIIIGNRTVDVHINKLREKMGDQYIHTYKGIGYKFEF